MEFLAQFSVRHLKGGNRQMFTFDRLTHSEDGHGSVDVGFCMLQSQGREKTWASSSYNTTHKSIFGDSH